MRPQKIVSLTLILLAMASCARPAGSVVADPAPASPVSTTVSPIPVEPAPSKMVDPKISTNPLDDPRTDSRITYSWNFHSDPLPTPLPQVAVSKESAEATAARDQFFGDEAQPGTPITVLRMVTLGAYDEGRQPHLAWVLTWQNSEAVVRGGFDTSEADRRALVASRRCVFVIVINAASGEAEEARQSCRAI